MSTAVLKQRIAKALTAHAILQSVLLLIRVLEIPLFLSFWTIDQYGRWLVIAALPSLIQFSDGGISKTISRQVAILLGEGKNNEAYILAKSTQIVISRFSTIGISILLATATAIAATSITLDNPDKQFFNSICAALILIAQAIVVIQLYFHHGIAAAAGNAHLSTVILAMNYGLIFTVQVTTASITESLTIVATTSFSASLVALYIMTRLSAINSHCPAPQKYNKAIINIKPFLRPSLSNLLFPIGEALNLQGIRIAVGVFLGPQQLVLLTASRTLARVALQPVLSIPRTIEPELSKSWGQKNYDLAHKISKKAVIASFMVATIIAVFVYHYRTDISMAWTKGQINFEGSTLSLLLISSVLSATYAANIALISALNRHTIFAIIYLLVAGAFPVLFITTFQPGNLNTIAIVILTADTILLASSIYINKLLLNNQ